MHHSRKAVYFANTVLNPLWLKMQRDEDLALAHSHADMLKHFQCPEFDEEFIKAFKMEIPKMIERAKCNYDWDGIKSSRQHATRLQNKSVAWPGCKAAIAMMNMTLTTIMLTTMKMVKQRQQWNQTRGRMQERKLE